MNNCFEISSVPYRQAAKSVLPDYTLPTIGELADKYCEAFDAGNDFEMNGYFSALVLRFWNKISKIVMENATLNLEYSDGFDWVVGAILLACEPENRVWQKNKKVSAQQAINTTLNTRFKAQAYYESNLQKNQGKLNMVELDEVIDTENDTTVGELLEDVNLNAVQSKMNSIVQDLINRQKVVEAIIVDNLFNRDVYKVKAEVSKSEEYKYTTHNREFKAAKLVKELNDIDNIYVNSFLNTYEVPKKLFEAAITDLKKANNTKKYKMIDKVKDYFREHSNVYC